MNRNEFGCRLVVCLSLAVGFVAVGCNSESPRSAPQQTAPPEVEMLEIDEPELEPGASTTVTVGATDPEGRELAYRWSVDDSDWTLEADGEMATLTAPDSYGADVTVEVVAQAGDDASQPAEIGAETVANELPRIGGMSASPNPVAPGGTTTLVAEASDENGEELSFEWSVTGEWSLESTTGREVELTAPDTEEATAEVGLTVTDPYGGTDTGELSVATRKNAAPVLGAMTAVPPQVGPGETTTVKVTASDPDGDDLNYSWSAPDGWTIDGEGAEVEVGAPDSWGVEAEIGVEVTDGREATTASIVVSTVDNDGPMITALNATPETVAKGGSIEARVSASDPDGDTLSYNWTVDNAEWALTGNDDRANLTAPDQPGSQAALTVVVTDTEGNKATASVVVSTRDNQTPVLAGVDASPREVAPGGTIALSANAQDPDGDGLTYDWSTSGNWSLSGSGASVSLTAPGDYGVAGTVDLEVRDGFGGTASATVQVSTKPNADPTISSLTASPPRLQPRGTSSVEVLASDPDGDALSYNWTVPSPWSHSSTGDAHVIEVQAPDQTSASARVRVEVTDGHGGRAEAAVVVHTRLNQPPVIKSLSAAPSTLEPDETTTVTAKVDDPDGDALNYNWTLPVGWTGSSTTSSIDVTAPREYDKTVDIELEATDGQDSATRRVSVQTVSNQKPVINSFDVSANPVRAGQSATANVQASDPLGDSLSYSWNVSNNDWGITGSGASVQLQAPNTDSTTDLTVTVDDGFGATVSRTEKVESQTALYSFASHRFSTCGASGRSGPSASQCRNQYNTNWDSNGSYFDVQGGIQRWTVPKTATYRIEVAGAEGGTSCGGRGARLRADFQLNQGDDLKILVGQQGNSHNNNSGGGGGGTFVATAGDQPLIVAGGGASGINCSANSGDDAVFGRDSSQGRNKGDGLGGHTYQRNSRGGSYVSGGGGFRGDGDTTNGTRGKAFVNGGRGADGYSNGYGGFGGGGGYSNSGSNVGGGGGGYTGGHGNWGYDSYPAGAGGSYVAGSAGNRSNIGHNSGDGEVTITER